MDLARRIYSRDLKIASVRETERHHGVRPLRRYPELDQQNVPAARRKAGSGHKES